MQYRGCLLALLLTLAAGGCQTVPPPAGAPVAPLPPPQAPGPAAAPPPLAPQLPPPQPQAAPPVPAPRQPVVRYPKIKPGDYRYATAGGDTRYYGLHVPAGYDGTHALPVVIVLHGRGGSAVTAQTFGFSENADRDGFFVVYPEAVPPARMWFTGLEADTAAANDVSYVRQLLSEVQELVNIDPHRIYAVGYSNGGTFAAHLAGALSGRIMAIAVVDANIAIKDGKGGLTTVAKPKQPVSALFIHGRSDHASPFGGGVSPVLGGNMAVGAQEGVGWWAETMGCDAAPKISDSGETEQLQYSGCRDGVKVQLTSYLGAHDWPKLLPFDGKRPVRVADYIMEFFYGTGEPRPQ